MIDNEKNKTRKNEEQTREEWLKERELSLDDLEQVSGGSNVCNGNCIGCRVPAEECPKSASSKIDDHRSI